MQRIICECGKGWTIRLERTREKQPAHEIRCEDCGVFITGLERDDYQKITAIRDDGIEEGPNPFYPSRSGGAHDENDPWRSHATHSETPIADTGRSPHRFSLTP